MSKNKKPKEKIDKHHVEKQPEAQPLASERQRLGLPARKRSPTSPKPPPWQDGTQGARAGDARAARRTGRLAGAGQGDGGEGCIVFEGRGPAEETLLRVR